MPGLSRENLRTPSCRTLADNVAQRLHQLDTDFGSPLVASSVLAESSPPRLFLKPKIRHEDNRYLKTSTSVVLNTQPREVIFNYHKAPSNRPTQRPVSLRRTAVLNSANDTAIQNTYYSNKHQYRSLGCLTKSNSDSEFSNSETEDILRNKHHSRLKRKAAFSPLNKENLSPSHPICEVNALPKRTKNRKHPSVSPKTRPSDLRTTRTFLVPKIKEPKSDVTTLLPRHESLRPVVPKKLKVEEPFPALPTQILSYTPKPSVTKRDNFPGHGLKKKDKSQAKLPDKENHPTRETSRQFLVAPEAGAIRSITSISSLLSLPSQILKHTPIDRHFSHVYSSTSPCLSKARVKTVWTMVDEMKLVRTGGLLRDTSALEPITQVRVVPLCQRLRNGVEVERNGPLLKTPARSASMPYYLTVSKHRNQAFKDQMESADVLPASSSITGFAGGKEEQKIYEKKKKRRRDRSEWTIVDVKKSERRFSQPIGAYRSVGTKHNSGEIGSAKPSLLTRAQTLMKFKFPGSKKVVGRGDPKCV